MKIFPNKDTVVYALMSVLANSDKAETKAAK